uniref:Ankyrin repeat domain protein n=1 Tax=Glypta fumiferanae TaxID=389681 RepID=A0A0F6QA47_9HYME|nr:ankyrin repeat domain protein [Glypta fumiferanae]AKD28030.1 ankyrin repeat domain protein [Glypta fumiferanae]
MGDDPCQDLIRACSDGDVARTKELIATHKLSQFDEWSGGYRLLREALKGKHRTIAKLLLESGSRVNSEYESNNSPLHFAVLSEDAQIVSMLLDRCADVDAKNNYSKTALYLAVVRKNLTIAELLLNKNANVNLSDRLCRSALYRAVEMRNPEMTELLLRRGSYDDSKALDGMNPLYLAIEHKNVRIVEDFLNSGPFVNLTSGKYGETPLHHAATHGNEDIVKLLIDRGANVSARNERGLMPIHLAATAKNDDIVEILLKRSVIDADARNDCGKTLLNIIIEQLDVSRIREILKIYPELENEEKQRYFREFFYSDCCHDSTDHDEAISSTIEVLMSHGFTVIPEDAGNRKLLHAVVDKGSTVILKILLDYGADVDSSHIDNVGYTLLHHAANRDQLDIVRMLIEHGADVNAIDGNEKFPLSYAIENVNFEMIKLLVSRGARIKHLFEVLYKLDDRDRWNRRNPNKWDTMKSLVDDRAIIDIHARGNYGESALEFIMFFPNVECENILDVKCELLESLLNHGADVNAKTVDGHSLLYSAVQRGLVEFVEILLKHNADVNIPTNVQMSTPLHLAVAMRNERITRMLIVAGAEVNAKDKFRQTALRFACNCKDGILAGLLLECGATIDDISNGDLAPLHIAAINGSLVIVRKLLDACADVEYRQKNGETALYLAMMCGHCEIVEELLNYGADVNHSWDIESWYSYRDNVKKPEDMYSPSINHHNCFHWNGDRSMNELISRHIVKLKSLNRYLNARNLNRIRFNESLRDFQIVCEREVESMKREKIGKRNISYYDIMTKSIDQLAILSGNKCIADALETFNCDERFPEYGKMLYYHWKRGQHRGNLLRSSVESLNFLSGFALRGPMSLEIMEYLNNEDLKNLIEAGSRLMIADKPSDNLSCEGKKN